MKIVSKSDYYIKKHIADNLEDVISSKFIEISDEEFDRINTAIISYNEQVSELQEELAMIDFTPEQKTELFNRLDQLAADIEALRQVAYDSVSIDSGVVDLTDIK